MKIFATILLAFAVGGTLSAATKFNWSAVTVCMEGTAPAETLNTLTASSSRLFREAGVKLEWHRDRRPCQREREHGIVISFSTNTPKTVHPGALACAYPYDGVHIQVFFDRIALSDPELLPHLLAHVIVHEVTHIMQGIDRHSKEGIMKAQWNSYDFTKMKRGQLRFTTSDIEMIHDGLAARAAHPDIGAVVFADLRQGK